MKTTFDKTGATQGTTPEPVTWLSGEQTLQQLLGAMKGLRGGHKLGNASEASLVVDSIRDFLVQEGIKETITSLADAASLAAMENQGLAPRESMQFSELKIPAGAAPNPEGAPRLLARFGQKMVYVDFCGPANYARAFVGTPSAWTPTGVSRVQGMHSPPTGVFTDAGLLFFPASARYPATWRPDGGALEEGKHVTVLG